MNNRDEFDDPKGTDLLGSIGPKAAFFIVLIALSFMIGVVWKLYVGGGDAGAKNVPVIRADTTPYKVDPEEPGGMEMPNKDSTIFSSLNSDPDKDRGVENLLAETSVEEPLSRSELFAGLNTEPSPDLHAEAQETPLDRPLNEDEERIMDEAKQAKAIVTNLVEDGVDAIEPTEQKADNIAPEQNALVEAKPAPVEPKPIEKKVEAVVEAVKPEPKKVEPVKVVEKPKPVVKAKPKPAPAPKKVAAKKETPKVLAKGTSYVQLASVRDRAATGAEWAKLKAKYGSLLSSYKYRVETADLGAKGVFYRIQAGPVSKSQAQQTCAAIKRKVPGGCLVK